MAVDGEPFDAVVVASGRFRSLGCRPAWTASPASVIHAFDYPGADRSAIGSSAGLRQRGERAGDRVRPGRGCHGRLRVSQATLRPAEERGRRSVVRLAVVHALGALRRAAMSPSELRRTVCASGCDGRRAIPPTSERPSPARTSSSPVTRCARTTSAQVRAGSDRLPARDRGGARDQVTFADGNPRER